MAKLAEWIRRDRKRNLLKYVAKDCLCLAPALMSEEEMVEFGIDSFECTVNS